jgi:hypothetical protein
MSILDHETLAMSPELSVRPTPPFGTFASRASCFPPSQTSDPVDAVPESDIESLHSQLSIVDLAHSDSLQPPTRREPGNERAVEEEERDDGCSDNGMNIDRLRSDYEGGCPFCLRTWHSQLLLKPPMKYLPSDKILIICKT